MEQLYRATCSGVCKENIANFDMLSYIILSFAPELYFSIGIFMETEFLEGDRIALFP